MKNTSLILVILLFLNLSCTQNPDNHNNKEKSTLETQEVSLHNQSYKVDSQLLLAANDAYKNDPRTKAYVDDLKETWKDYPSEFTATFTRAEFGDYFHLVFEDNKGNQLDFGNANNYFSEYNLILESNYANSNYLNKKFKLKWDWLPSNFNCCEGNMDEMVANVPTIMSLELIKE